jgi:hypothetical protein
VLLLTAAAVLYTEPDGRTSGPPASGPADRVPSASPVATPTPFRTPPGRQSNGPLPIPSGSVGVPIRLDESAALAVVRPGDRVDLLAVRVEPRAAPPLVIASGALVLAVPAQADELDRGVVYLALSPDQARQVVGLPSSVRFAVIVRP